ncbi:Uncharacterised protein [uncultured Blautia sp.]|nr:Uncharacterised protein [uncultured Blautia sp.]
MGRVEALVDPEDVTKERGVLGQKRSPKCRRRLRVLLSRPVVPAARLQQVDPVLAAQKVQVGPTQVRAEIIHLMLGVQADHRFPRLQHIAEQELEQVGLALAGVTQDRGAAAGLVVILLIQIHEHIGAISLMPDVESMRVRFSGITDRIEVGNAGGGKDPLRKAPKDIPAGGIGGLEPLELTEDQGIRQQPAPAEHG